MYTIIFNIINGVGPPGDPEILVNAFVSKRWMAMKYGSNPGNNYWAIRGNVNRSVHFHCVYRRSDRAFDLNFGKPQTVAS